MERHLGQVRGIHRVRCARRSPAIRRHISTTSPVGLGHTPPSGLRGLESDFLLVKSTKTLVQCVWNCLQSITARQKFKVTTSPRTAPLLRL